MRPRVHRDGHDWVAECKTHDEVVWCEHWIDALEAAYGHVAMWHPAPACDCGAFDGGHPGDCALFSPGRNLDTSPTTEDAQ